MRCKCCNVILEGERYARKSLSEEDKKKNLLPEFEDLCRKCKSLSKDTYSVTSDHEYMLQDLEGGLTEMKNPSY